MGEVVLLPAPKRKPPRSAPQAKAVASARSFLCCSCSPDERPGWIPIVETGATGWTICGLLCTSCSRQMAIENGREAK